VVFALGMPECYDMRIGEGADDADVVDEGAPHLVHRARVINYNLCRGPEVIMVVAVRRTIVTRVIVTAVQF
jgi:hypothetical protein